MSNYDDDKKGRRFPFIPFYVTDFRGHPRVRSMDFHEQALYTSLIFDCWESDDDTIPDDPIRLAKSCRVSLEEFKLWWPAVRDMFVEKTPGRLTHPRVDREKGIIRAKYEKRSKGMKESWAKKKGEKNDNES